MSECKVSKTILRESAIMSRDKKETDVGKLLADMQAKLERQSKENAELRSRLENGSGRVETGKVGISEAEARKIAKGFGPSIKVDGIETSAGEFIIQAIARQKAANAKKKKGEPGHNSRGCHTVLGDIPVNSTLYRSFKMEREGLIRLYADLQKAGAIDTRPSKKGTPGSVIYLKGEMPERFKNAAEGGMGESDLADFMK